MAFYRDLNDFKVVKDFKVIRVFKVFKDTKDFTGFRGGVSLNKKSAAPKGTADAILHVSVVTLLLRR